MNIQSGSTTVPVVQPGNKRLVWWRDEAACTEVPRRHVIGWSLADGSRHGSCAIDSEHLRLSREQIETRLAAELAGDRSRDHGDAAVGRDDALQPAYECWAELSPAVRIVAGGHRLVTFDLQRHYGSGCLAGVSAELRGQGIAARIVLDSSLTPPEKDEALVWAEPQLSTFRASDPAHLRDRDWTETAPSRWQILLYRD